MQQEFSLYSLLEPRPLLCHKMVTRLREIHLNISWQSKQKGRLTSALITLSPHFTELTDPLIGPKKRPKQSSCTRNIGILRQTIGAISELYYIIINCMLTLSISLIHFKKRPFARAHDLDSHCEWLQICRSAFFKIQWRHQLAIT